MADAVQMYSDIFRRAPPPSMLEVLELKVNKAVTTIADLRTFLKSLKDDAPAASAYIKPPAVNQDPLYAGLRAAQDPESKTTNNSFFSRSNSSTGKEVISADALRGVVCNDPAFVNPSDPYKETRLADTIQDRNTLKLMHLCEQSKKSSAQEAKFNQERVSDKIKVPFSAESASDLVATPLEQARNQTSVGSLMPRFVYAEYV
jgi:hypothetical protein